jgi:hypothetical protein
MRFRSLIVAIERVRWLRVRACLWNPKKDCGELQYLPSEMVRILIIAPERPSRKKLDRGIRGKGRAGKRIRLDKSQSPISPSRTMMAIGGTEPARGIPWLGWLL